MVRKTSALAPTSMPRLGSSISSTLGSVISALPMTTFCWLPPDSEETSSAGSATLIDRSRIVERDRRLLALAADVEPARRSASGWRASGCWRPRGSRPGPRAGGPPGSAPGRGAMRPVDVAFLDRACRR